MSITICINETLTEEQGNVVCIPTKDSHGNDKLLKALYEDTSAVTESVAKVIPGELSVDKIAEKLLEKEIVFSRTAPKTKKKVKAVRALPTLVEALRFEDHGHVDIKEDLATYYINLAIDKDLLSKTSFYVRWGSYDDVPENWEDLAVASDEIIEWEKGRFYIAKPIPPLRRGWYGATCYAVDQRDAATIWQGSGFAQDAKFRINQDSLAVAHILTTERERHFWDAAELVVKRINNYDDLENTVASLYGNGSRRDVARILFEATKDNEGLRAKLSNAYYEATERLSHAEVGSAEYNKADILKNALNNLGVGEVVLVAPEGPQATFGGLAQVMEGFLKAFPRCGVPVTLISLLYEQAQGNRHADAASTLRRGLVVNGETLKLKYAGEVDIPFGPTYRANTSRWVQRAYTVRATVYMVEKDGVRIVLLRHNRFAGRLYPRLMGDEHLRRAIFLCRGALEVMKTPSFGIKPQLILSNDWLSALVPAFLKLDQRYCDNENLRGARTIHLVHNCGRDYQGRFPNHHDGQNLYPLLELNPVHWEGMMDPHQKNFFNLTASAVYHLNGAVLAVSRPYAQALLSREGGEGLDHLMWKQRDAVFGISNGVDQAHLQKMVSKIGEGARHDLGWGRTTDDPADLSNFFEQLISYKEAAKLRFQKNFGLHQNANQVILSLVGRLAEQKGIQILMERGAGDGCSVLELILRRFADVQIVVAGPRVDGDDLSGKFCALVDHLRRCFGGRVVGIFDFVPHDFAMEVFTASDFALMPSRFEPGGLTQLEALAAGSLVVARNVGGISATLERFDDQLGRGNGFMFDDYSATALRNTVCWAIDRTRDVEFRKRLMLEAAKAQHDWGHRVPQYLSVFQHLNGVLAECNRYPYLSAKADMLAQARA